LERESLIKKRFFVSKELLKENEFDFFQLVVFCTDEIQHFFWKHMEEGDPKYGNVIEDFWKLVDSEICELLNKINGNCYTFVISDHGATALKGIFRLNVWLKLKGYLHLKRRRTPSYRFLVATITKLKIFPTMRKILPYWIVHKINRKMFGRLENVVNKLLSDVDWQKTKAICISDNCIHLSTDGDLEEVRNELIDEIKNLKDSKSGQKVVEDVRTKEEVFKGKYLSAIPDLIIIPKEGYRFCGFPRDGGVGDLWDFSRNRISGWHRLNGVFLAHGPEISKNKKIDGTTIYDIVPTILHIFGVPIPLDIDGRVSKEIFQENSNLKNRLVTYEENKEGEEQIEKGYYSQEEEKRIVKRLTELGYM
jgi:predicted AlkP superfamily phosphohydrolase/phosphomutase